MRRRAISCLSLVTLAAGVFAAAAAAEATSSPANLIREDPPAHVYAFSLGGSHGYDIDVFAASEGFGSGGRVQVGVGRGSAFATYSASAIVTADAIQADLGRFGTIDVTLNGSGREKTIPIRCSRGETYAYEPGTFEGVARFRGEQGYTGARATVVRLLPLVTSFCGSGSGRGETAGSGGTGARLRGISFAHGRSLSFQVNKNRPRGRALFRAEIKERQNGVAIDRAVGGWLPAPAFDYDHRLRTATLSPPAPFSGLATLARAPNSVSPLWSGDLALDFPGRTVRLAGPGVNVTLVHACFTLSDGPFAESC
jgi:hypothetical protein